MALVPLLDPGGKKKQRTKQWYIDQQVRMQGIGTQEHVNMERVGDQNVREDMRKLYHICLHFADLCISIVYAFWVMGRKNLNLYILLLI